MYCTSCDARLHLSDIENERRYGLGSILFIRCQNSVCSSLNDVRTGKRNSGTFDINSKLALAMVHTGMGPVQTNNLLATLNLPPVVPSTLKKREQKIDTTLETIAKKSCLEPQKEEIEKGNGKTKDSESLRKSLDIIVPHLYGDHSPCANEDVTWCSYQKNPSQFRSFGSSKSLTGRISASVLQKNEGHKYLEKVNKAVGLSPGEFTFKMALKTAAKRKLQKAKQISLQAKRKHRVKKISKSCKEATKEIHEGVTYSEAAELHQDEELTQTTEIPNRSKRPENPFTYVVFDTETTGRERNSDILQIAAGHDFNVYAQPRCEIYDQASAVNMLRYDRRTNTMFHRGIPVTSKPIQEALLDFIDYLKKVPQPVLVGHNACSFDIPIISNRMAEFKLFAEFSSHVFGFVDTLKISKRIFQKSDVVNYKQENLVSKLLTNCTYQAHDAKEDVRVLTTLFTEKIRRKSLMRRT
ncbi:unnamed protein product [Mytilus coruscus]|uniref:Exonuclease domain-containing protein n=1 Tax=Mytilus coruscus TaxID=42192 RepID=A0A6J8DCM4_MYTCO|nr:unnamed protein product [Mytilus coruscus]